MTTENVDTSSIRQCFLKSNGGAQTYSQFELLIPNVSTLGADSVASVTVDNAGTGFTGIPSVGFDGDGSGAEAFASMKALTATVAAPGSGYAIGNALTASGGTFTTAFVATIATLRAVQVAASDAGSGYVIGDQVTLNPDNGTSTVSPIIQVDTVGGSGEILTWHFVNGGSFTVVATTFTASGGAGSGASFNTPLYGANTVNITTPGRYSALPTTPVSVTGGAGTGAQLTPTYGVDIVTMTDGGQDYTEAPDVVFTGGGGSGAAATAVLASTGDPSSVDFEFNIPLPTEDYTVTGTSNQAAVLSSSNKTTTGFTLTLTPLTGVVLAAGSMDVSVKYSASAR